MKRIGTAVLCFVMLFALLAFPGFAAETEKTATAASSEDILLRGYQNQLNTTGASAVSVRIIAEIANVENYTEVGFYITTAKMGKMTVPAKTVYSKLTATKTDETGTAFEEEIMPKTAGNYLFALILTDINVSANAEMTVVPYAVGKDGVTVTGGTGNLQKPAGETSFTAASASTYQVTFQTEDGTPISTVSVKRGENAPLPAAPSDGYWAFNLAELVNITENKTITLGKVATSAYQKYNANAKQISCAKNATSQAQYSFKLGSEASNLPTQNSHATFLSVEGHSIEFTADLAGTLTIWGKCNKISSVSFAVYVDGYLFNSMDNFTKSTSGATEIAAGIPAGQHTIRIVLTAAGTPSATSGYGLFLSDISFQEPQA